MPCAGLYITAPYFFLALVVRQKKLTRPAFWIEGNLLQSESTLHRQKHLMPAFMKMRSSSGILHSEQSFSEACGRR